MNWTLMFLILFIITVIIVFVAFIIEQRSNFRSYVKLNNLSDQHVSSLTVQNGSLVTTESTMNALNISEGTYNTGDKFLFFGKDNILLKSDIVVPNNNASSNLNLTEPEAEHIITVKTGNDKLTNETIDVVFIGVTDDIILGDNYKVIAVNSSGVFVTHNPNIIDYYDYKDLFATIANGSIQELQYFNEWRTKSLYYLYASTTGLTASGTVTSSLTLSGAVPQTISLRNIVHNITGISHVSSVTDPNNWSVNLNPSTYLCWLIVNLTFNYYSTNVLVDPPTNLKINLVYQLLGTQTVLAISSRSDATNHTANRFVNDAGRNVVFGTYNGFIPTTHDNIKFQIDYDGSPPTSPEDIQYVYSLEIREMI